MEKILKIGDQPIEAYQGLSFIQSVMVAHENTNNNLYNRYINLTSHDIDDIFKFSFSFSNCWSDDFHKLGCVFMDQYDFGNIKIRKIADFLRERIDSDSYLLLYSVDEYYISYSKYYRKKHYTHDVYLYGYSEKEFLALAYTNDKLKRVRVSQTDLVKGIFKGWLHHKDCKWSTMQVNPEVYIKLDLGEIVNGLSCYINCTNNVGTVAEDNKAYGMAYYRYMKDYIRAYIENAVPKGMLFDIRFFRMFLDHKIVMRLRFEKIHSLYPMANELVEQVKEIESKAMMLFRLIIKYKVSNNPKPLIRTEALLMEIYHEERELITRLIEFLKTFT